MTYRYIDLWTTSHPFTGRQAVTAAGAGAMTPLLAAAGRLMQHPNRYRHPHDDPHPLSLTATKPVPKKFLMTWWRITHLWNSSKLYKKNPVLFVKEVLNTQPDPWQIEFLNHIAAGNRRISVRSGHGVGKSTASAWAMIWYLF